LASVLTTLDREMKLVGHLRLARRAEPAKPTVLADEPERSFGSGRARQRVRDNQLESGTPLEMIRRTFLVK